MKNWHDRIYEAKQRGHFTEEDADLADSWVTCACGEQDAALMTNHNEGPRDLVLRRLGYDFNKYVLASCRKKNVGYPYKPIKMAELCLAQIEERANELLEGARPVT
jgi:hypothetical protein